MAYTYTHAMCDIESKQARKGIKMSRNNSQTGLKLNTLSVVMNENRVLMTYCYDKTRRIYDFIASTNDRMKVADVVYGGTIIKIDQDFPYIRYRHSSLDNDARALTIESAPCKVFPNIELLRRHIIRNLPHNLKDNYILMNDGKWFVSSGTSDSWKPIVEEKGAIA